MNVSYGLAPHNGTAAATAVAEPSAPARRPVVDACSLVYDDAGWRAYLNRLGENAAEYLDVFSSSFCRYFGPRTPPTARRWPSGGRTRWTCSCRPADRRSTWPRTSRTGGGRA